MKILHVVGARPNFMKAAPVLRALANQGAKQILVHTGQHYDANMSDVFFRELNIPEPDVNLGVGSGSHSKQTAEVMTRFEPVVLEHKPDLVLVYGDVNSTAAAAFVCAKLLVRIGHVEAGLRSFDRTMPEEVNRLVTDQLADLLFTPSQDGNDNLAHEGVAAGKIHLVGNVMIDTLVDLLPRARERWQPLAVSLRFPTADQSRSFALVTLHRPSNVDDPRGLSKIMNALERISRELPVIFPVHPRTRQRLLQMTPATPSLAFRANEARLQLIDPVGYIDFLALQSHARMVITDSGGVQEETTFLGVPCLTVRENTERPVTVTVGTNILVGQDTDRLWQEVERILKQGSKSGRVPPLWDGKAGARIAKIIMELRSEAPA